VHSGVERSARGRIDVEHQMRLRVIRRVEPHQGRVVLDCTLIGEPQQRGPVVAQRIGHLALRAVRPDLHRPHPGRRVLRDVLLHEGLLTPQRPDHRQRPVPQLAEKLLADRLEVVDQVPLRRLGHRQTGARRGWSAGLRRSSHPMSQRHRNVWLHVIASAPLAMAVRTVRGRLGGRPLARSCFVSTQHRCASWAPFLRRRLYETMLVLDLIETRTFGSRVIRALRARPR
jgi:hypothetical protein